MAINLPTSQDKDAVRGVYLCLNQLTSEARSLGLKFAVAHMNVALLEIADVLDDPQTVDVAQDLELHFANDEGGDKIRSVNS
jgi:hypothetical protein